MGHGLHQSQLESYMQEKRLQSQAPFKGIVRDLNQLYGEVNICALTSLLQECSKELGEYAQAGMAVIA